MLSKTLRTLAFAVPCWLAAATASADIIVLPVSEDTAPYSFLPSLARYNNPTLYAFDSVDESGTAHDFETYLWFDVSAEDLPIGHVLTGAQILVTYAFDFTGFGDPSTDSAELHCREVTEAWDETSLTWSNRPVSNEPFDVVTEIDAFGALLCDATPVVFDWMHGTTTNHGFALANPTERVIGMHSIESSADPSLLPQLILTTEVPEPGVLTSLMAGVLALASVSQKKRTRSTEEHAHASRRSPLTRP